MSRSYRAPSKDVINGNISSDTIGEITNIEHRDRIFYNIDWSGGIGFSAQAVAEYQLAETGAWEPLDFGSTVLLSGASGNHQLLITEATFLKVRLSLNSVAGSADVVASVRSSAQGV